MGGAWRRAAEVILRRAATQKQGCVHLASLQLSKTADGVCSPTETHLAPSTTPTIALTLDLSDFEPIFAAETAADDDNGHPTHYSHPCRCSGTFIVREEDLEAGVEVFQCDGCTERCRVEYEELEDDVEG